MGLLKDRLNDVPSFWRFMRILFVYIYIYMYVYSLSQISSWWYRRYPQICVRDARDIPRHSQDVCARYLSYARHARNRFQSYHHEDPVGVILAKRGFLRRTPSPMDLIGVQFQVAKVCWKNHMVQPWNDPQAMLVLLKAHLVGGLNPSEKVNWDD